uniref:NPR3-like, GATOR1 complex subunit n=1 Tax=Poecilia reticulata TaxID=8081 RepID=A0A3P9NNL1_POERE
MRSSQNNRHKSGDKTSPISVILVSSGSRGNKLLFRYPFQRAADCPSSLSGFLTASWPPSWPPRTICVERSLNSR